MMAAQNPPDSFLHFKQKAHTTNPLVLSSLTSTVPFAIPATAETLEKSQSRSAPSSPIKEDKKRRGFLKHLPRARSPSSPKAISDPERSPSPNVASSSKQGRPKWLAFRNHKRKKSNNSVTPVEGSTEDLSRTLEPEATPAHELPGRTPALFKSNSGSSIPVITVSHSGEENHLSGSLDDVSQQRKLSQCSHCSSNFPSTATSGVGSLLSPSGDECYDLESPSSPLSSRTSSFTENTPSEFSDFDRQLELISPSSEPETIVSPDPGSSPPPLEEASSPTDPNASLTAKQKKKKERSTKVSSNFHPRTHTHTHTHTHSGIT